MGSIVKLAGILRGITLNDNGLSIDAVVNHGKWGAATMAMSHGPRLHSSVPAMISTIGPRETSMPSNLLALRSAAETRRCRVFWRSHESIPGMMGAKEHSWRLPSEARRAKRKLLRVCQEVPSFAEATEGILRSSSEG